MSLVYRQGRYSEPEQPTWPALPWRRDVPDATPLATHRRVRSVTVAGVGWSYCRTHRTWEPPPLKDAA